MLLFWRIISRSRKLVPAALCWRDSPVCLSPRNTEAPPSCTGNALDTWRHVVIDRSRERLVPPPDVIRVLSQNTVWNKVFIVKDSFLYFYLFAFFLFLLYSKSLISFTQLSEVKCLHTVHFQMNFLQFERKIIKKVENKLNLINSVNTHVVMVTVHLNKYINTNINIKLVEPNTMTSPWCYQRNWHRYMI